MLPKHEHVLRIAGEYEIHRCDECNILIVYKIVETRGSTKKMKKIAEVSEKQLRALWEINKEEKKEG